MSNTLMVLLGCDCDPDRPRYGGIQYDSHRSPQKWQGLIEGIDFLRHSLKNVEKATGVKPGVVFCIRSDIQMKEIYGTASWAIREFADTWRELESEGHELAWHPHLWRWSDDWGCWFQETEDSKWIVTCLETGFSEFCKAFGRDPTTSHVGWTFSNNIVMKKLSELGLSVDFSASPGVYFAGGPGDGGTMFHNRIDWLGTPQKWYRPSEADYRRPSREGENELPIVEIPKFTMGTGIIKKLKDLASRGRTPSCSETGTGVFLQVTVQPILYTRIIKERLRCEEAEPFLGTYFHPDELLGNRPHSATGFLYSPDNLEKNLVGIIKAARKKGRDVAFCTGPDALRYIKETGKQ